MKSLSPLNDRILLADDKKDETTQANGLVVIGGPGLPSGTVLAVGPGITDERGNLIPIGVEVGDRVVYSQYGGIAVPLESGPAILVSARDLLGKVVD